MTANKPDCAWSLADLASAPKNGLKVMSTFACGGGSSMGYKRAGCEVIAANDIDPEMAWHYKLNINPKHYFLCPINELLEKKLPEELYSLDILDGSPPCSTFSMAGSREKAWGKEKHFREGQAKQVLSDLFFDYLNLVGKLKPKVAIAENVKGMLIGNAKGYTKMVMARFKELGYRPQLFLLNGAFWPGTKPGHSYADEWLRLRGKPSGFNMFKLDKQKPSPTLTATDVARHWNECRKLTYREWKRLGSYPDDYQAKSNNIGKYMVGMSVPPKMTEQVARAVIDQWLLPKE